MVSEWKCQITHITKNKKKQMWDLEMVGIWNLSSEFFLLKNSWNKKKTSWIDME